MKWTLKLVSEVVPGKPTEYEVATIERIEKFSPATVGLTISEGNAILAGLQKQMVTAQVQHHGASIPLRHVFIEFPQQLAFPRPRLLPIGPQINSAFRRCPNHATLHLNEHEAYPVLYLNFGAAYRDRLHAGPAQPRRNPAGHSQSRR